MKKKFSGALAAPVSPRRLGLLASEADHAEFARVTAEEEAVKLRLLCQHYGIPESPQQFRDLSLALAQDFVQGFQEQKKRGRPSKWTTLNMGTLVVEIERLMERAGTGRGAAWAAKQLAKREPWKSFLEQKQGGQTIPDPAEALRQVYQDFKDTNWASVFRKSFKWHEQKNTVHEWDAVVIEYVKNPYPN